MNMKLLSAVYGILQLALDDAELLDRRSKPIKKKGISIHSQDVIAIYKWLAEKIVNVSGYQLEQNAADFNKHAEKLHDDYLLNMTLMGIYLLDNYMDDMPKASQLVIKPKIERVGHHFSYHVERDVFRDSRIAANNLYRVYTGKAELTKEVREANANKWRRHTKATKRDEVSS